MKRHTRVRISSVIFTILLIGITGLFSSYAGHTQDDTAYDLQWSPEFRAQYYYTMQTRSVQDGEVRERSDRIMTRCTGAASLMESGPMHFEFVADALDVDDDLPLGDRFDKAQFDDFAYTVLPDGTTFTDGFQLFPPVLNVPMLPDFPVMIGSKWFGGSIDIIPQRHFGPIQASFESEFTGTREYMEDNCAVIETVYEISVSDGTLVYRPYLGIVSANREDLVGQGVPVGQVVMDSPAHSGRMLPGDLITHVEGQQIRGWSGLMEISQYMVPGMTYDFTIRRGDQNFNLEITSKSVRFATVSATGVATSSVIFSLDRGIPLKIEFTIDELNFITTYDTGEVLQSNVESVTILEFVRQSVPTAY